MIYARGNQIAHCNITMSNTDEKSCRALVEALHICNQAVAGGILIVYLSSLISSKDAKYKVSVQIVDGMELLKDWNSMLMLEDGRWYRFG